MNRIEAIYSFITEEDKVVDVGCDQAKLSLLLAKRNQSSIAADISENVINKAKEMIQDLAREVVEGEIYTAKVVKIENFGCFVEVWPGCEGLVHISKLAKDHIEKVEDVVKLGDEILVKAIGTDNKGRLNFSRKDALK